MITALVVLGIFAAYLIVVAYRLWGDCSRAELKQEHVCVFDAGIVECGKNVLIFCTCGNTRVISRGMIVR